MKECFQDRRLKWFVHLEGMEESAKVSGSLPRQQARKTWNEVIRSDVKKKKVTKDIAKDGNV